jgi:hypothetical protein
LSQPVNQRWRERPRCPALRVTPGRRDGVVHAIVGRVARRRFRAVNVQDERAARVHLLGATFAGRKRFADRIEISAGTSNVFPAKRHGCRPRSRRRTIAFLMLAPCSALSMLSAPLRPGRRPGLRALTTPPRGAFQQLRDGRQLVDHSKRVTRRGSLEEGHSKRVTRRACCRRRLTLESRRRMLKSSRRCRMALPPFAATAAERAFGRRPKGAASSATPQIAE